MKKTILIGKLTCEIKKMNTIISTEIATSFYILTIKLMENTNTKSIELKLSILLQEIIPVGFKRTTTSNFSLDGNCSTDYLDSVYSENKYSLLTLDKYLEKGGVNGIFKEGLSNFIKNKGDIEDYTKEYMVDFYIVAYEPNLEKDLINELYLSSYDEYKNKNHKNFIELDNIRYSKGSLQDNYYLDKENHEREENIFNLKIQLLSQIKN